MGFCVTILNKTSQFPYDCMHLLKTIYPRKLLCYAVDAESIENNRAAVWVDITSPHVVSLPIESSEILPQITIKTDLLLWRHMMHVCTNKHKLLACIKCPGSVNCPEYAGAAKKFDPKMDFSKKVANRLQTTH